MEWQPIETAPKDGEKLLMVGTTRSTQGVVPHIGVGWYSTFPEMWIFGGQTVSAPTHWQPLPPPPDSTNPLA